LYARAIFSRYMHVMSVRGRDLGNDLVY